LATPCSSSWPSPWRCIGGRDFTTPE
jgi:hypothetical protein